MTRFKKTESGELFGNVDEIKDILDSYDTITISSTGDRDVRAKIGDSNLLVRIGYDMKGNPSIWANLSGNGGYAQRLLHDADTWEEDLAAWLDEKISNFNHYSKKEEATKFGVGLSKRKDFSKCRNLGDILEVLENHHSAMEESIKKMEESKQDITETLAQLKKFDSYAEILKQQSTKGIKKALALKSSPEVKAAGEIESALKGALSIIASDYSNVDDITQLMTVIDSKYATRGSKILTVVNGNITNAIEVDCKALKDSIDNGEVSEEDVVKLATVTQVVHGVTDKGTVEKVQPILERMNAMIEAATKLEDAVINPKEFADLRDAVKHLVDEASAPKDTIKTSIVSIDKDTLATVPTESKVSEGILDKIKAAVSAITGKLAKAWQNFTSMFFKIEDEALEASDVFNEVELGLAIVGVSVTEAHAKSVSTLGKQFEVLTKSVLTCCDKLAKDASLAGEFDDELIYAEDAVANAIESFNTLGQACQNLKKVLEYHKNEDNMAIIGILADAITQIVAADAETMDNVGGDETEEDESPSVVDDIEREYSPETEEPEDTGDEYQETPTFGGAQEL